MSAVALLMGVVPSRLWWALGGAVVLGLLVWLHGWHAGRVIEAAVLADRAVLQGEVQRRVQELQADALRRETAAVVAGMEVVYGYQTRLASVSADVGRAAGERDRLRNVIAALRGGDGAAPSGASARSLADAAGALADSLGECGGELVEVAAERDRISVQLTALQGYITWVVGPVCVAGLASE